MVLNRPPLGLTDFYAPHRFWFNPEAMTVSREGEFDCIGWRSNGLKMFKI